MKIRPLFEKYQRQLIQFANTKLGRLYLKAENLPIIGVYPDAICYLQDIKNDRLIKKSVFYSRSPYLLKFHTALEGLEIASDLMSFRMFRDFGELVIPHFQGLITYSKLPLLMRTVTIFNPDGHPETDTVDGRAGIHGQDAVFSTMREIGGTFSTDSTDEDNSPNIAASTTQDQWATSVKGIFLFKTSSLPVTNVITAAIFSIKNRAKIDALSGDTDERSRVVLVSSNPASNTALQASDGGLSTYGIVDFGRSVTQTNIDDAGNYNDITLNAKGRANISKTSISKFGIIYGFDFDNDITGLTWVSGGSINYNTKYAEQAVSTDRPQLAVTHVASNIKEVSDQSIDEIKKIAGVDLTGIKKISGVSKS